MKRMTSKTFKTGAGEKVKVSTFEDSTRTRYALVEYCELSTLFKSTAWKAEYYCHIFNSLLDSDTYFRVGVYLIDFFTPLN